MYIESTKLRILEWKAKFNETIDWKNVTYIHFNDDKKEVGSKVDKHADLWFETIDNIWLKEIAKLQNLIKYH